MRKISIACLLLFSTPLAADHLKVKWLPNADADLAGYFVYYGKKNYPHENRIEVGRQTEYTILDLEAGETYFISVTAADTAGNESVASEQIAFRVSHAGETPAGLPPQHYFLQSYPNPFYLAIQQQTTITFALSEVSPAKLEVFDLLGKRVRLLLNGNFAAGVHEISWNGRQRDGMLLRSGIYLYRLETSRQISTQKVLITH